MKGVDAALTAVNCLQFTAGGAADYVALANDITTTTSWTNELDVNWSHFGSAASGVSFLSADDQTRWWRINGSDGNNLFLEGKIGNTQFREKDLSADVSLSLNTTYRIKTVWSGTSVALYIDGVLKNTYTWGNDVTPNTFGNIGRPTATSGTAKISNWKFYHNGILEADLPLAEGSGTKAYDISGKGNHGTINNSTWTTADGMESWNHEYGFDAAAVFDGTDDRIDTGLASDAAVTKASFTIKPENDGANRVIIGLANKSGTGNASTFIGTDNKLKYKARSTGSNLVNRCDTTVLTAGNTYDVVIEYGAADGTGTSVTINGVTQSFTAVNGLTHSGGDLLIGARETGSVNSFYQGEIHSLQLETSSGVIRDFVPSDGKLLDKVNNTYYSNGGSGDIETKRIPALNTKTKQVATFDGVADNVLSNTTGLGAGDFYYGLKFKYKFKAAKYLFLDGNTASSQGGAWSALQYGSSTGGLIFITDDDTTKVQEQIIADGTIPDNSIIEGYVQRVGGTISFNLTNLTNSAVYSGSYSNTTNFFHSNANRKLVLGGAYTSSAVGSEATVEWFDFKAGTTSTNLVRHYDFQSDIGTTTVQDTTANNNDGTVTVGSGGTATFWGQRVADTAGSLVSADYATGNTSISNPLGFVHNNSECGVKLQSRSVITGDGVSDFVTLPSLTPVQSKTIATKIKFPAAILSLADNEEGAVYGLSGTGANLTPHLGVGFLRDVGDTARAFYFRDGNYVNGGYEISSNDTNYSTKYAGKTLWVIVRIDNENRRIHMDVEGEFNITHNKSIDANATAPASLYNAGIGGWINTSSTDSGKVPIFDFIYYERVLA